MNPHLQRFPDMGRVLRRSFHVAEQCFDCACLYDGCKAKPQPKSGRLTCGRYTRLPDVLPGACGQTFPETPALRRLCYCGEPMAKGKRLCDSCRTRNRRRTKREHMRQYMKRRRDSGRPFPAQGRPPRRRVSDERKQGGLCVCPPSGRGTSVLTPSLSKANSHRPRCPPVR